MQGSLTALLPDSVNSCSFVDEKDLSACIIFFPEEVLQNQPLPRQERIFLADERAGLSHGNFSVLIRLCFNKVLADEHLCGQTKEIRLSDELLEVKKSKAHTATTSIRTE